MTTISLHRNDSITVLPRAAAGTAGAALVAAVAAVPPITLLHLGATGPMEPVGWTISDYVVGVQDGVVLYAMTAGALAVGGLLLARALRFRRGTAAVRTLLGVWALAVVMTAVFPTNVRGTPETLSSTIHLMAGAIVFAVLPLAGCMLSRMPNHTHGRGRQWLGRSALVAGLLSAALILNRLPAVVGMPQLMLPPGIRQRVAGAALILLLAIAARTVSSADVPTGSGRSAGPGAGLPLGLPVGGLHRG